MKSRRGSLKFLIPVPVKRRAECKLLWSNQTLVCDQDAFKKGIGQERPAIESKRYRLSTEWCLLALLHTAWKPLSDTSRRTILWILVTAAIWAGRPGNSTIYCSHTRLLSAKAHVTINIYQVSGTLHLKVKAPQSLSVGGDGWPWSGTSVYQLKSWQEIVLGWQHSARATSSIS